MKTWKIFKAGSNTIAYVNVNEKDNRDTSYDGIDYILESMNCALWTNEAHGFCRRSDGSERLYLVDFNNKQELLPVSVGMPV